MEGWWADCVLVRWKTRYDQLRLNVTQSSSNSQVFAMAHGNILTVKTVLIPVRNSSNDDETVSIIFIKLNYREILIRKILVIDLRTYL